MSLLSWVWPHSAAPAGPLAPAWDFHCHLLPEVDDGIKTLEESLIAIEKLIGLGYQGCVLTPHIYAGVFDNEKSALQAAFAVYQKEVAAKHPGFKLHLAAEYFADAHFLDLVRADTLLVTPVGTERWVLVEFPYLQESPYSLPALAALTQKGYRPVIAHLERYRYMTADPASWLKRLAPYKPLFQCDIGSLVGQHGTSARRLAQWLLKQEAVALWGTDLHAVSQVERFMVPGLPCVARNNMINPLLAPLFSEIAPMVFAHN